MAHDSVEEHLAELAELVAQAEAMSDKGRAQPAEGSRI